MELESWRSDLRRNAIKQEIKNIFDDKIRGKEPIFKGKGKKHAGWKGHWLEKQFGVVANNKNKADYKGFEIKDSTRSKVSFGDWTADEYIFFSHVECENQRAKASVCPKCKNSQLNRDKEFLHIFGTPNPKKNRYSWSGSVFPKVGETNSYGQTLEVSNDGEVRAIYDFSKDRRENKDALLPNSLQSDYVVLAKWRAASLNKKLREKFGVYGWAKVVRLGRGHGIYTAIQFGGPIEFDSWIKDFRKGIVYLDSGMHQDNPRPYSPWRADNSYWNAMAEETYP